MLKVVDDGVSITLVGKDKNPLFVMASVLVVLAIGVAVVAMTMPVQIIIGVMAVFAVLVFGFNIYKNRLQYQSHITNGQITIKRRTLITNNQNIKLTDDVQITLTDGILIIKDIGRSWYISGFESDKECHVAKSVLEGKVLEKKEKAIRIL